ncbi:hypothetical protein MJO28_002211 [Puccinia striiformis f. sp. tritici]|uniref:Uncharacterized protein n=1 Tax=Puccinia striiformis f. sp. tritici TaxID=168172 RepID=A0ACC0EWH7_9BASI|nr:hypothetical protein MJO28_002211 [Puccinia striiformis f. sp. tritici]KAI7966545.1 hypothetical protein MJO29_002293 [Puccinia striiformis f. sp. tritici]
MSVIEVFWTVYTVSKADTPSQSHPATIGPSHIEPLIGDTDFVVPTTGWNTATPHRGTQE